MPPLQNARQELFCQRLAQGTTKIKAYVMAGYRPDDGNACRLTGNDRVKQRIAELQQATAERAQLTVGDLLERAEELRLLAIQHRQISAGVAALKEAGILSGLRIDRREVGSPGEFERLTDDELKRFIASETARLIELPVELMIELPDDEPDKARGCGSENRRGSRHGVKG